MGVCAYWFVYKTHFQHTVALASENVVVRGLMHSGFIVPPRKYTYQLLYHHTMTFLE